MMMESQHVLKYGSSWGGATFYSFSRNGKLIFGHSNFHSEAHAIREVVWHLNREGIDVKPEDIKLEWDGTL